MSRADDADSEAREKVAQCCPGSSGLRLIVYYWLLEIFCEALGCSTRTVELSKANTGQRPPNEARIRENLSLSPARGSAQAHRQDGKLLFFALFCHFSHLFASFRSLSPYFPTYLSYVPNFYKLSSAKSVVFGWWEK